MKPLAALSLAMFSMCFTAACASGNAQARATPPQSATAPWIDDEGGRVTAGRELVVRECASCHAIDQNTASPRAGAPAMKNVLDRYDPDMLADDLIEGIRVGHDEMPSFDFNVIATDELIAYLRSIAKVGVSHGKGGRGS